MTSKRQIIDEAAAKMTKDLIDGGKPIEAGFAAFAHFVIPKDAPPIQTREMRLAFMAGAEFVFQSIMSTLDPGENPTDDDMKRVEVIHDEIQAWRAVISERLSPARGSA